MTDVLAEWQLVPDGAPPDTETALVLPVRDDRHMPLMLKLGFVEDHGSGEIPALKAWRGLGAVRLERADPRRGALLLERLTRRDLGTVQAREAWEVLARLYRRLHIPAPPTVPDLAPRVTLGLDRLRSLGREVPAPRRLVEQALHAGPRLLEGGERVVLHGDLSDVNVLAGRREPWLVVDPRGLAGDPCFEIAPALWHRWDEVLASGDAGGMVREGFSSLVDAAGYDERRCRDWVVVRSMLTIAGEVDLARRTGRQPGERQRRRITRAITVAKAVQAVGGDPGW